MSFYREAGGGVVFLMRWRGLVFLMRFVCEHLIKVNNCCYGRYYGKSHILPIRNFTALMLEI